MMPSLGGEAAMVGEYVKELFAVSVRLVTKLTFGKESL